MYRKKQLLKNITLLVIATIVLQLVAPCVAYAVSGGPSQPEALQFEPVDNTDIVNLATGDFVYTLPLIDVPGPEGGYPMALSYHAGIGVNQEATWVGLGWSLNPGAINRAVSGYPDDYKGDVVTTHYQGSAHDDTWGVCVTMGIGPIGINMRWDANTGMMSGSVGLSYQFPIGKGFSINVSVDENGAGIGFGYTGKNFSAGVTFGNGSPVYSAIVGNDNFSFGGSWSGSSSPTFSGGYSSERLKLGISNGAQGTRVYGSVKTGSNSSVGFSMATSKYGASFSLGAVGVSTMSQASAGNFSQYAIGIPIPIPIPFFSLSISKSGWSWYIYETYDESVAELLKGKIRVFVV